jgi:hypothetical protein
LKIWLNLRSQLSIVMTFYKLMIAFILWEKVIQWFLTEVKLIQNYHFLYKKKRLSYWRHDSMHWNFLRKAFNNIRHALIYKSIHSNKSHVNRFYDLAATLFIEMATISIKLNTFIINLITILLLNSLINSTKLNERRILLPYNSGVSTNFTLEATNHNCYQWFESISILISIGFHLFIYQLFIFI